VRAVPLLRRELLLELLGALFGGGAGGPLLGDGLVLISNPSTLLTAEEELLPFSENGMRMTYFYRRTESSSHVSPSPPLSISLLLAGPSP